MKRILLLLTLIAAVGMGLNTAHADETLKLGQNYPNPAIGKTYIDVSFTTPHATLKVYNVLGKLVEERIVVESTIVLDVSQYTEGVYLYTLEAGGEKLTRRMTVKRR